MPGGSGFMLLSVRYRLSVDDRVALVRQRERMAQAKGAGIARNVSGGYR